MFWQRMATALMTVIVAIVAVAVIAVFAKRAADADARLTRAEEHADSLMVLAAEMEAVASYHEARADSIERDATQRLQQVRERVVALHDEVVPDTCAPFVAPRDTLLDEALAAADTLRVALDETRLALGAKDSTIAALRTSHDTLRAVVRDARRSWKPTLGVTVGACTSGDFPCAAVGLTWRF